MDQRVKLIEVIGPAGAGKSALGKILNDTNQVKWVRTAPYFRRIEDFSFFAVNTLLMLQTFLRFYINRHGRWFTSEEIAWMVILNGWSRKLRNYAEVAGRATFVDEGPIFHLAYFFMRGPGVLHSPCAQQWWRKMYLQVANTTDLIVCLDASNEVLLRRIRTRKKSYLFASATDEQVCQFVDKLRTSYAHLLPQIVTQKRKLKVLVFDTEQEPVHEIAKRVLMETHENSELFTWQPQ